MWAEVWLVSVLRQLNVNKDPWETGTMKTGSEDVSDSLCPLGNVQRYMACGQEVSSQVCDILTRIAEWTGNLSGTRGSEEHTGL